MDGTEKAWDNFYSKQGIRWKGSPAPIPDLPPGSRFLDVGCGTGSTMIQALEKGYLVSGIDISNNAIKKARDRMDERGLSADLNVMDARSTLKDLGRFDCVMLHHVLDAVVKEDRKCIVENCKDILAEGGYISFQDFSTHDIRFGNGEMIEEGTFSKMDGIICHFFTLEETGDLFGDLETIELEELEWEHGRGMHRMVRSRIRGVFRKIRA